MSDFLQDLGKGAAGTIVNGALNTGLGLLGQSIVNKQARENYKWQYDNFLSPKAQVKGMTAAGLNPAAAFGNNAPVLNSGGLSIPSNPLGGIGTSSLSEIANYINAKAQAHKAGVEAEGTDLDNYVKRSTLSEAIKSVGLKNKWNQAQIEQIDQNCALMSGQFEEIQQRIDLMKQEEKLTEKNVQWFDRHMSAEISYIKSSKEYQDALKGLTDQQKQLLENTMEDLCRLTTYQADQMQKIVGLLDKYGDAQAIVGMLSQVVGSASDLIGSITSLKNVGKAKEIITDAITTKSDGSSSRTYTKRTSR